jgi:hypothetical protein
MDTYVCENVNSPYLFTLPCISFDKSVGLLSSVSNLISFSANICVTCPVLVVLS